ncbi:ankyrin repeat domain-containing protein 34B [Boleophthalmus pectinirostris]|uniref:ankyrin repeat domain-containing protein 34B n=1 Tax=Boleophthalmus pectinirostris TaxID=150288 RepID=UPI00242AB558|nr:ankyrin repeat domain-containing protein 34B [Boleophthalmus pectinirostris]
MDGAAAVADVSLDTANPLLKAVFLRRLRLTRLLLDGGAYVNESDSRGHTPLMVACRTPHSDGQSASRVKLVQFLLERGADPNIQDKTGRSALMHACRELAGAEVVSLLLSSGADISLEDQTGTSALVYAVTAGDWKVVRLLLDTCKASGKEVIIITADKLPCGTLQAKQYLSMPPISPTDKTSLAAPPTSPSEVQLITSPQISPVTSASTLPVFSFKETSDSGVSGVSSHPCSPSRLRAVGQTAINGLQQPLLRLNSEPWLKIPASILNQQLHANIEQAPDINHNRIQRKHVASEDQSSATESLKMFEDSLSRERKAGVKHLGHKISLPGLLSPHSASHPNLHSENLGDSTMSTSVSFPNRRTLGSAFNNASSSSLYTIIQKRNLGSDIYSSDPQIAMNTKNIPEEPEEVMGQTLEGNKLLPVRCSSTLGAREPPLTQSLNRRVLSRYERRGSGTLFQDSHLQSSRPNMLPPLNSSKTSVLGIYSLSSNSGAEKESNQRTLIPSAPPGAPKELTRRMLLRRHSMQTEYKTSV